jgi:hypothetical protein
MCYVPVDDCRPASPCSRRPMASSGICAHQGHEQGETCRSNRAGRESADGAADPAAFSQAVRKVTGPAMSSDVGTSGCSSRTSTRNHAAQTREVMRGDRRQLGLVRRRRRAPVTDRRHLRLGRPCTDRPMLIAVSGHGVQTLDRHQPVAGAMSPHRRAPREFREPARSEPSRGRSSCHCGRAAGCPGVRWCPRDSGQPKTGRRLPVCQHHRDVGFQMIAPRRAHGRPM